MAFCTYGVKSDTDRQRKAAVYLRSKLLWVATCKGESGGENGTDEKGGADQLVCTVADPANVAHKHNGCMWQCSTHMMAMVRSAFTVVQ